MSATEYQYAFEEPGRFARGWYVVQFSHELQAGDVKALHFFNQDLVIFRGESGDASVLDAYCPHLGAHLAGTGSRVEGDCIRCPFHGWQFNGRGACESIPYAKNIPKKAAQDGAIRSWPVREHSGFISIWYDEVGGEPNWELPTIDDWNTEDWGDWSFNRAVMKAHGREVIENIVDVGHFPSVHGGFPKQFDNIFRPYSVTQISVVEQDPSATMIQPSGLDFDLTQFREERTNTQADAWGDATYHGPAVMYYYTEVTSTEMSYKSWWVNYHTPINNNEIELTSGIICATMNDQPLPQEFRDMYPMSAIAAFGQDAEIWKTKKYQANPILCDGDGPVTKLRKWYERFYLPREHEAWNEPPTPISSIRD